MFYHDSMSRCRISDPIRTERGAEISEFVRIKLPVKASEMMDHPY